MLLCLFVSIIAIHLCIAVTDLTKLQRFQNRLDRVVTKSPPFTHGVPLLHCLPVKLESLLKISFCWNTKRFMKNSLFICTPRLPHLSHQVHWDQTQELVCRSLGSRPTQAQELFALVCLVSLQQPTTVCSFSLFSCYLEETSLWLCFYSTDTRTPDGPLMLWNCFIDLTIEYWFGCYGTESGFTGDIDATEIW